MYSTEIATNTNNIASSPVAIPPNDIQNNASIENNIAIGPAYELQSLIDEMSKLNNHYF